ncbi:MAG: hypothetical protein QHC78_09290 [Pigmentiphaga sp.]|uniref:hypothetical protein n=1 Tax=Pigmentiphaga sp. TaxID=1977564 RepID=UPI0029AB83B7|nr:hypothetical protein [Pigmentiphaga sp.]MDX3905869.1 hypothetical protein [Pigmentiphaga sp.]
MIRLGPATFFTVLLLVACGGESETPPASVPHSVEDLESQGQLPVLDRSADLAGPDIDNNGVRDDIDAWIGRQGGADAWQKALRQLARTYQGAVRAGGDAVAAQDVAARTGRAIACVMTRSESPAQGSAAIADMRKMTANTKARVMAYLDYSAALDGAVMSLPPGDGCDD